MIDQHRAKSNTELCLVRHILYRLYCIRRKPHFLKKERLLKNALLKKYLKKKYTAEISRISGLCKGGAITTQNSGSENSKYLRCYLPSKRFRILVNHIISTLDMKMQDPLSSLKNGRNNAKSSPYLAYWSCSILLLYTKEFYLECILQQRQVKFTITFPYKMYFPTLE